LTFNEHGLRYAHMRAEHPTQTPSLLGDDWIEAFVDDLDNINKDIPTMQRNHTRLRHRVYEQGIEHLQQESRRDRELSKMLSARADDEKEDAEELQRQCDRKQQREDRMRRWAASLTKRSQVSEQEEQLQKELDDMYL
jgi:hypothetical protein